MCESLELNSGKGLCRTDIRCTECHKNFVARLDFDIDGNHKILCPHCGHIHWRVIKAGVITEDRWNRGAHVFVEVSKRNVWKHNDLHIETTSAAEFLRDLWLNPSEGAA